MFVPGDQFLWKGQSLRHEALRLNHLAMNRGQTDDAIGPEESRTATIGADPKKIEMTVAPAHGF